MILLVGAGAVGSILATYLSVAAREPLKLYVRAKDRAAMDAATQLRVDDVDGRTLHAAAKPPFTSTLDLAGVDYLFLCVKFAALDQLLDELPPIPASCTVVSTLNGIEPLRLLKRRLPSTCIAPMSIMYNGQLLGPLHGQLTTKPIVVIGDGQDARVQAQRQDTAFAPASDGTRLLGCFDGSGMKVQRATGDSAVWGKLLINLANAVLAITHRDFKDLFTLPDLRRIYVAVLDEAIGLLDKTGVPYKLPMPLPYRAFRWMLLHGGPLPWWIAQIKNGVRAGSYPSMVADVEQGRTTEVRQLNGEIVRLGMEHGVKTPVASTIVALIEEREGQTAPAPLSPAQLRTALGLQ